MSLSLACAACCEDCGVIRTGVTGLLWCAVLTVGAGFKPASTPSGNGRSETRSYGMGSVRWMEPHVIRRFAQLTLAGYGANLPGQSTIAVCEPLQLALMSVSIAGRVL